MCWPACRPRCCATATPRESNHRACCPRRPCRLHCSIAACAAAGVDVRACASAVRSRLPRLPVRPRVTCPRHHHSSFPTRTSHRCRGCAARACVPGRAQVCSTLHTALRQSCSRTVNTTQSISTGAEPVLDAGGSIHMHVAEARACRARGVLRWPLLGSTPLCRGAGWGAQAWACGRWAAGRGTVYVATRLLLCGCSQAHCVIYGCHCTYLFFGSKRCPEKTLHLSGAFSKLEMLTQTCDPTSMP